MNPYLNERETAILVGLVNSVRARTMIEFGCNLGRTARELLWRVPTLERYVGIDVPPNHVPTLACQRSEVPSCAGLFAHHDPRFELLMLAGGTRDIPADVGSFDAIFIDGDHSKAEVRHDSELARKLAAPGAIVIWHDHGNAAVEVTETLEALAGEGWQIEYVIDSWLAYMRI